MRSYCGLFWSFLITLSLSMGLNAQGIDSSQTNWSMPGINTPDNINTIYTFDPITGFYICLLYTSDAADE